MIARADFTFTVVDDVIVIIDLDRGGASVTNDASAVLNSVDEQLGGIGSRRVIYRDSMRIFDGIDHDNGRFVGFYPIRETEVLAALAKLETIRKQEL